MINKIVELILHRRRGLLAVTLLLTIVLFYWFIRVEIGSEYSRLFPPKADPVRSFLHNTRADFGSDRALLIAIKHDKIFSAPTLAKIDKLTADISKYPAIDNVLSLTNANIIKAKKNEIYLQNVTGKVPATRREIDAFRKDILDNPLYSGNLISDDEKTTVISVTTDTSYPDDVVRETVERVKELSSAGAGPEEIHLAGPPAINEAMFTSMASDLTNYIPITLLIIAIILLINFKKWWCTLLSLVVACIALEWTYAFMAIFKVPIFLFTAVITPIIAALAVSYSVHLFAEYFRQRAIETDSKTIIRRSIQNILLAIWLSAITTAIGFACLSAVNIIAVREFSIFLVVGVTSLLLLITFFIPSILTYIRPESWISPIKYHRTIENSQSKFVDWVIRYRYIILAMAALSTVPGALGLMRIKVDTNLYEFFKESAPIRHATDLMIDHLHGATDVTIIVEAREKGDIEDPVLLKSIEILQSRLDQQPHVGKSKSVVDYLKTINKAFHDNDPKYHVLPSSKEMISQYLLIYSLADSSRTLDGLIDYDRRIAKISIRGTLNSSASIMNFSKQINELCAEILPPNVSCKTTGDAVVFATSARNVSHGILFGFGLAALAISVVMLVLFRSLKMGAIAMIPNLIPLLSILAVMGLAEIDFNIGTSMVICLAIGIAVDDTIHLLTRYFHELKKTNHYLIRRYTNIKITRDQLSALRITVNRVRRPIILTSVIIFCGFMVLVFSEFVPIIFLGFLTALTMVFCLLCDLVLLPAIIASVRI